MKSALLKYKKESKTESDIKNEKQREIEDFN